MSHCLIKRECMPNLPKCMSPDEFYLCCRKQMTIQSAKLRETQDAVEVKYVCKCGHFITFIHSGSGFVEVFKKEFGPFGSYKPVP